MGNTNLKEILIPAGYHNAVKAAMQDILNDAKEKGNLRSAMVSHIALRADKLPQGVTAEGVVDSIFKSSGLFTSAVSEAKTSEDIEKAIRASIRKMTSEQSAVYLCCLEVMFCGCDQASVSEHLTDCGKFKAELKEMAEKAANSSPEDLRDFVSKLAKSMQGDSFKASIFASGNPALCKLLQNETELKDIISADTAAEIHAELLDNAKKAEIYAATACACYSMILDGKFDGVSAENLDAGMFTALVSSGMEKTFIMMRLMRGEIDQECATSLLSALARATKWILVKLTQALIAAVGSYFLAFSVSYILAFCGLLLTSAWWTLAIWAFAACGGIQLAIDCKENIEAVIGWLGELCHKAQVCVVAAIEWTWERLVGSVPPVTTAVNTSVANSVEAVAHNTENVRQVKA